MTLYDCNRTFIFIYEILLFYYPNFNIKKWISYNLYQQLQIISGEKVKLLSRVWLFATPWTVACQESSIHGIFQARVLEWVAFPSPGDLPDSGIEPGSPALQADAFTVWTRDALLVRRGLLKINYWCYTYPSQTILKNWIGRNTCELILWGQHHPNIKTKHTQNCRPISLMNTDARLLDKNISQPNSVIQWNTQVYHDQVGFIKGWRMVKYLQINVIYTTLTNWK